MKKITSAVLTLIAFTFNAQAQTSDLKLGAKAGINFSTFNKTEVENKTGFNIGVIAEYFINEKFSIQPEILYSSQGGKNSFSDDNFSHKIKSTLDYINIPIMAKYYIYKGFNVQAGPQIGFLVNAEEEDDITVYGITSEKIVDIMDETNLVDFGLNFGLGYELPIGVFSDARYNLGLSKTNKGSDSEKASNRVLQISLGYKF